MFLAMSPCVDCSGGLELLFGKKKVHELSLEAPSATAAANDGSADDASGAGGKVEEGGAGSALTLQHLIVHIRDHVIQERPELFAAEDTVYVLLCLWASCVARVLAWRLTGGGVQAAGNSGAGQRCRLGTRGQAEV